MSCLQHKIEKAESFLHKLKALVEIAENHLHDTFLLRDLEYLTNNYIPGSVGMAEIYFGPTVANSLTRLGVKRPSVEVVKKLIDMFPMALECPSENGLLPIQNAAMNITSYAKYIHLFVRDSCSGHLYSPYIPEPNALAGKNVLQYLVSVGYDDSCDDSDPIAIRFDELLANTIDVFYKQGFITEEDIENHELLALSCNRRCMRRFACLARWHKEALKTSRVVGTPLLHHHLLEGNLESIEIFLRVSFQHFPDESGLLFYGDYSEEDHVPYFGLHRYSTLEKVIRPMSFPLLHQICKRSDVERLLPIFYDRIPLRDLLDEDGRSYHQAIFAYCNNILGRHVRVDNIPIVELETKDPVTGLLPFMTVAANDGSVGCIYELILKHPTALLSCIESSGGQKGDPMTLKRKRDNSN